MVRIVPSPDWFVGVDSLDLCDGSRWREQVTVDLHPHDAGTDSGFTFSSPNFATVPQDTVTEVRGPLVPCLDGTPSIVHRGPVSRGVALPGKELPYRMGLEVRAWRRPGLPGPFPRPRARRSDEL